MGVLNHLRHLAGSGGEGEEQRIGTLRADLGRGFDAAAGKRHSLDLLRITDPALALTVHDHAEVQERTVIIDFIELVSVLLIADDDFEFAVVQTSAEVFRGQEGGRGALHGAEFHQSQRKNPPLRDAGKHDKHAVALRNAMFEQKICGLVGETAEIKIGEFPLASLLVHPDHRETVSLFFRPLVDDVVGEVVIFRYFYSVLPQLRNGSQIFFRKLVHFRIPSLLLVVRCLNLP